MNFQREAKLNNEIWKAVIGYEGRYEVSSCGKVRALYREQEFNSRWGVAKMRFSAKQLIISTSKSGYKYVSLSKNSVSKKHLVHRLVLAAFSGASHMQVNHKDGSKENNNLENLEYCSPAQNLNHCISVLGKRRGERAGGAKLSEADIPKIREDDRLLRVIAAEYGVTIQAICLVKKRRNWAHVC